MSSGTEPDLRPPGAAFAASACPERSRGCRAIFFPLRRAGFVPPPRGYVLSPSTFLPLPELRASCTSYDQMFFYLLHYPTSVNARLSFVSRWHDKVERHPNLIIGDHGYRLHPPITAGRQQIPSAIARVEAQQVGPAFCARRFSPETRSPRTFFRASSNPCPLPQGAPPGAPVSRRAKSELRTTDPQDSASASLGMVPAGFGRRAKRRHFLSSTSTYSASMTPSSFFC